MKNNDSKFLEESNDEFRKKNNQENKYKNLALTLAIEKRDRKKIFQLLEANPVAIKLTPKEIFKFLSENPSADIKRIRARILRESERGY